MGINGGRAARYERDGVEMTSVEVVADGKPAEAKREEDMASCQPAYTLDQRLLKMSADRLAAIRAAQALIPDDGLTPAEREARTLAHYAERAKKYIAVIENRNPNARLHQCDGCKHNHYTAPGGQALKPYPHGRCRFFDDDIPLVVEKIKDCSGQTIKKVVGAIIPPGCPTHSQEMLI